MGVSDGVLPLVCGIRCIVSVCFDKCVLFYLPCRLNGDYGETVQKRFKAVCVRLLHEREELRYLESEVGQIHGLKLSTRMYCTVVHVFVLLPRSQYVIAGYDTVHACGGILSVCLLGSVHVSYWAMQYNTINKPTLFFFFFFFFFFYRIWISYPSLDLVNEWTTPRQTSLMILVPVLVRPRLVS